MRVLKERYDAGDTEYVSSFNGVNSEPGSAETSTFGGYAALSDAIDDVMGPEDDDGFFEGSLKGIGDAVIGAPMRSGAAIGDYQPPL